MKQLMGLIVALSFTLTSCFDIIEEVKLKENGSGSFKMMVSMLNSKEILSGIMNLDSMDGYAIPSKEQIEAELIKTKSRFESNEGIDNYTYSTDWENFIFKVAFDFDSIENVNLLLKSLATESDNHFPDSYKPYSFVDNMFSRSNNIPSEGTKQKGVTKYLEKISGANFITIYKFEREIDSVSNPKAKIGKSGKSCFMENKLVSIINKSQTIENTIKLK